MEHLVKILSSQGVFVIAVHAKLSQHLCIFNQDPIIAEKTLLAGSHIQKLTIVDLLHLAKILPLHNITGIAAALVNQWAMGAVFTFHHGVIRDFSRCCQNKYLQKYSNKKPQAVTRPGVLFRYLSGQLVNTKVTVHDQANAGALHHQVILAQVSIVHGVAHQHGNTALGNALHRLGVASDNIQHVVRQDKVGRANLVALLHGDQVSSCQFAHVAHCVNIALGLISHNSSSDLAQSLLGANNGGGLAGRSLNMGNQVQHLILVKGAGLHVGGAQAADQAIESGISSVQIILGKAAANHLNHVVKVNTTSQNTVQLLVNLNSLQLGMQGNILASFNALTADALGALGNVSNSKQAILGGMENVFVTQSLVAVLNKIGKELVAFQTFLADLLDQNFGNGEQILALAITNGLVIQLGAAIIGLDQRLAQHFLAVSNAIFIAQSTMVAVNGKLNQLLINHDKSS
nr:MAG TPA: hypothetical protein [Caudoviricetes sp.]